MAKKKEKINWIKVENEYISSKISLRKLAEKYSVPESTILKKSRQLNWNEKRNQFRINLESKTTEKTIEKISEKLADRNARFLNISDMALDAIEEYLKDKKYKKHILKGKLYDDEGKPYAEELRSIELDTPDTKALSNIVKSLEVIQKGHRLAEGLDKPKEEESVQDDNTLIVEFVSKKIDEAED